MLINRLHLPERFDLNEHVYLDTTTDLVLLGSLGSLGGNTSTTNNLDKVDRGDGGSAETNLGAEVLGLLWTKVRRGRGRKGANRYSRCKQ